MLGAERNEVSERPSAACSTFSLFFKASGPLPPSRPHAQDNSRKFHLFQPSQSFPLSLQVSSLLAPLCFLDSWTTTINSSRNHAGNSTPLVFSRSHSFLGTNNFSLQFSTFPVRPAQRWRPHPHISDSFAASLSWTRVVGPPGHLYLRPPS